MVAPTKLQLLLTDEQRTLLKEATGREVVALEFPDVATVASLGRSTASGAEPRAQPEPPLTLSRDEHLHGLWIVLGLGDD